MTQTYFQMWTVLGRYVLCCLTTSLNFYLQVVYCAVMCILQLDDGCCVSRLSRNIMVICNFDHDIETSCSHVHTICGDVARVQTSRSLLAIFALEL